MMRERGSNLLEMAVVFPVLVILLAGMIDLGRGFHDYIMITGALREGARFGASFPSQYTLIEDRIVQRASESGITLLRGNITIDRIYGTGNDEAIRTTAMYQMSTILGGVLGFNTLTIRSYAEMPVIDPNR